MSAAIQVSISGDALAVLPRIKDQAGLLRALSRTLDQQNLLTVSHIQVKYLSYPSNGPTTLEGLRHLSGDYARSLHSSKTVVSADGLQSGIGSPVNKNGFSYPALHEFGGTVHIKARKHTIRLRVDARGNLIRQAKNPHLAVFAKRTQKRAVERTGESKDHDVTYPARAPIQRGIKDRTNDYGSALSQAVLDFWKGENA